MKNHPIHTVYCRMINFFIATLSARQMADVAEFFSGAAGWLECTIAYAAQGNAGSFRATIFGTKMIGKRSNNA